MNHDLITISIIQGITEFLPVSSTAHMMAAQHFLGIPSMGRLLEVALHLGTLLVIFLYFRKHILSMIQGVLSLFKGKPSNGFWLFFFLCVATLPVVLAGYMVEEYAHTLGRGLATIGWVSILSGIALYAVDQGTPQTKRLEAMNIKDALIIGILQTIALVPGVSRLGITLIGGRLMGYERANAACFSFLLSIPAIIGAMTLMLLKTPGADLFDIVFAKAIGLSFIVGLVTLFLFMWWLKKRTLALFALYRIAFGVFLLVTA